MLRSSDRWYDDSSNKDNAFDNDHTIGFIIMAVIFS
jgi:uncharacterized protein YodC (DUF2158 family)